eukprot:12909653-Prorocentrum_lima.AAC.1
MVCCWDTDVVRSCAPHGLRKKWVRHARSGAALPAAWCALRVGSSCVQQVLVDHVFSRCAGASVFASLRGCRMCSWLL